ncbi:MAG: InlB B-repeat-containing protein [Christensenellaceae bacterium]|jgi:uncharacterized repeat protein (TIGR02543 family)|nr:InlB B-repeat-containing protein [Christensenellaceae bacterium]
MMFKKGSIPNRMHRAFAFLLCIIMVWALVPALPAHAAVATKDNPVLFKVTGTVSAGTVQYHIATEDIYNGTTYQSITITYPKELTLQFPATLATTAATGTSAWRVSYSGYDASTNPTATTRTASFLIRTGSRTATQLSTDLASCYFTLATTDVFPPEGSKVAIQAAATKTTAWQDENGYVHYYTFVTWAQSPGGQFKDWAAAYNDAQSRTMQDPRYPDDPTKVLKGYLATITSEEEQIQVYTQIADQCGWLGGTRLIFNTTYANASANGVNRIQDQPVILVPAATPALPADVATQYNGYDRNYVNAGAETAAAGQYWYWADGPEAWTVYRAAQNGDPAQYQYYPKDIYTVPNNSWAIYNSATKKYTWHSFADVQPAPVLGTGQTLVADPNRGATVGPLKYWDRAKFTTSATTTATATTNAVPGVYSNWNNNKGRTHFKDGGSQAANGQEPNDATNETVMQFAWSNADTWNDYRFDNRTSINGYYFEFGGYSGDPKADELSGSDVESTSEVELVMPIIVQYRSTIVTGTDPQGNPIYKTVGAIGTTCDRIITYETYLPFTAVRLETGVPATIPGYTVYGYQFIGAQADRDSLTVNGAGDVSGFHSANTQRVIFLYKPDNVLVNFNANFPGATEANLSTSSKTAQYDSPYGALSTATRPGYLFSGWFTQDGTGNNWGTEVTAATLVPTQTAHTLYAKWAIKTGYIVEYDSNGGTAVPDKQNVGWNDAGLLPATPPTRGGYRLVGWDVSDNGVKEGVTALDKYSDLAESDAAPSIELRAHWVEEDLVSVIYRATGGTPVPADIILAQGSTEPVVFPAIARAGYTFGGWKVVDKGDNTAGGSATYTSSDTNIPFDTISSAGAAYIVLEAQWTPKTYTVSYDGNGVWEENALTEPLPAGYTPASKTAVTWSQSLLVPPAGGNPAWAHHIFMGWNTAADGSGANVTGSTPYSALVENDEVAQVTLYAQWMAEKSYFVRYALNGGTIAGLSTYPDLDPVYLDTANLLPPTPTPPTGFNFATWNVYYNGTKAGVTAADTFEGLADIPNRGYIVLQAQYSPKSNLTVRYDLNGAPTTGANAGKFNNKTGVVWTQTHLLPAADPVWTGHVFIGWSIRIGTTGIGPNADAVDTFGVLAQNDDSKTEVYLIARWALAGRYMVSYNLNGGSQPPTPIADVELVDDTPLGQYGYEKFVPAPVPVPPAGYSFSHWYLENNGNFQGNTSKVAAANGTTPYSFFAYLVDESPVVYANHIQLKAVYTEKLDFIVKYDWNYSGGSADDEVPDIKWTQTGFVPHTATQPGKTLLGWTTDAQGTGDFVMEGDQFKNLVGNIEPGDHRLTLYAQWADASFYVRYDLDGGSAPTGSELADYSQKTVGFDDVSLVNTPVVPNPVKLGYRFDRWIVSEYANPSNSAICDDVNSGHSFRDLSAPNAPYIVLKAVYSEITDYVVHYDLTADGKYNDSSTIAPHTNLTWQAKNLLPGGEGFVPANMSKPGYTFLGWKLSKIGSNVLALPEPLASGVYVSNLNTYGGLVTADRRQDEITLQAQWEAKAGYIVQYDFNYAGHLGVVAALTNTNVLWTQSALTKTKAELPAVSGQQTARDGWTLAGWFTKDGAGDDWGVEVLPGSPYSALVGGVETPSITLYAKWEQKTSYVVRYLPGTVTVGESGSEQTYTAYWWSDADAGNLGVTTGTKTYTIPDSDQDDPAREINWESNALVPPRWLYMDPIDGLQYHFAGWVVADDGTSQANASAGIVEPDTHFSALAANDNVEYITLSGTWDKSFAVFYALGGGHYTGAGYPSNADFFEEGGDTVTFRTTPERTGFTFDKWKLSMLDAAGAVTVIKFDAGDTTTYAALADYIAAGLPGSGFADNVTMEAQWTEDPDVTITYATKTRGYNGGAAQTPDTKGGMVSNADEDLPPFTGVATGSTATANAGYTFIGWYAASDTTFGTQLSGNTTYVPAKDENNLNVTGSYIALFEENANIAITYAAKTRGYNGGAAQEPTKGGKVSNASESLAPSTGTAAGSEATAEIGYHFVGWYAASDTTFVTKLNENAIYVPAKDENNLNIAGSYVALFEEDGNVSITYATKTRGSGGAVQEPTQGGMVSSASESLAPSTGNAAGSTATANAGYTFIGWYAADDEDFESKLSAASAFSPAKNAEGLNVTDDYIALFKENASVTITYAVKTQNADGTDQTPDDNGGSLSVTSQTLAPATGVAGSIATANAGYTFIGWYAADDEDFESKLSAASAFSPAKEDGLNVTEDYIALFKENASVTITYAVKTQNVDESKQTPDGNGGSVSVTSQTIAPATGVAGSTASANAGYTFIGWYAASDDKFENELSAALAFIPAKEDGLNVAGSYVALFRETTNVAIAYSATEGGNVSPLLETIGQVTGVAQGSTATAQSGYRFVGWYAEEDADFDHALSEEAYFVPEKQDGFNAEGSYVARFVEDDAVTIRYIATPGGSVSRDSDIVLPISGAPLGAEAAANPGYHFIGWYLGSDKLSEAAAFVPGQEAGVYIPRTYIAMFAEDMGENSLNANYQIEHYLIDAGGDTLYETETFTGLVGGTVNAQPKTGYTGYTFAAGYESNVISGLLTETGSLTLKLYYAADAPAEHEIAYVIEGNWPPELPGAPGAQSAAVGETVAVSGDLAYTGYAFSGWHTADASVQAGTFTMPDRDVEFTGTWTLLKQEDAEAEYRVEHYLLTAGDTPYETETFTGIAGATVNAQPKTGYAGYTFAAGDAGNITSGQLVEGDTLVLKLYYAASEHQVTYSVVGDVPLELPGEPVPGAPGAQSAAVGETVAVSGDLAYTGYTFSGWHTADAPVQAGTFTMPDRDVAFAGTWILDADVPVAYQIEHYLLMAGAAALHETETFTGIAGATVTAQPKTGYAGYTFAAGDAGNITSGELKEDESLVLQLYYAANVHQVTYRVEGDAPQELPGEPVPGAPGAQSAAVGETVTVSGNLTYTGYAFSGWHTADAPVQAGTFIMPDGAVEFVGTWTPLQERKTNVPVAYHIEHYLLTAGAAALHETETITGIAGATVTAQPKTGYAGYTFATDDAGNITSGELKEDESLVLKLHYAANVHPVTYRVEGDVPTGLSEPGAQSAAVGETVAVKGSLLYAGYTFSGWHTSDTRVQDGAFIMPDRAVEFVGAWVKNPEMLAVAFVDWDDTTLKIEYVPYGWNATAPTAPSRSGYTFTGWSISYANVTGNIIVVAQYRANDRDSDYTPQPTPAGLPNLLFNTPRTGDDSQTALYMVLFCLSGALAIVAAAYLLSGGKRKKRRAE